GNRARTTHHAQADHLHPGGHPGGFAPEGRVPWPIEEVVKGARRFHETARSSGVDPAVPVRLRARLFDREACAELKAGRASRYRNSFWKISSELSVYLISLSGPTKFSGTPAVRGTIGASVASGGTSGSTGKYSAPARMPCPSLDRM